jgi:hypothetical protein
MYMCVCMYLYIFEENNVLLNDLISEDKYVWIHIYMYVYICIYIYIYSYVYICKNIFMYVCIYMYIYIYIYVYICWTDELEENNVRLNDLIPKDRYYKRNLYDLIR